VEGNTLDKYEYSIKADKIRKLADRKDYATAAKIADTIDWERVKNVKMLSTVSLVYEKVERYEDAKDILLIAYETAPVGRRFLYRLTELAVKEGKFDEAEAYLKEYAATAPKDPGRLLLRYEIAEAKGEPLERLITILEAYQKREFEERWSYELASLYYRVGKTEECVKLCDEIILWFGVGTYVDKALELKQGIEPLTPEQLERKENKEKYLRQLEDVQRSFEEEEQDTQEQGQGETEDQEKKEPEPEEAFQQELGENLAKEIETAAMTATLNEMMLRETAATMEEVGAVHNDHSDPRERTKVAVPRAAERTKKFAREAFVINEVLKDLTGQEASPEVIQEKIRKLELETKWEEYDTEEENSTEDVKEEETPAETGITEEPQEEVPAEEPQEEEIPAEEEAPADEQQLEETLAEAVQEETAEAEEPQEEEIPAEEEQPEEALTEAVQEETAEEEETQEEETPAEEEQLEEALEKAVQEETAEAEEPKEEETPAEEEQLKEALAEAVQEEIAATEEPKEEAAPAKEQQVVRDHYILMAAENESSGLTKSVAYIRDARLHMFKPATQIAKISGQKLASKEIPKTLRRLQGRDLVISGIAELPDEVLIETIRWMAEDQVESFIVLLDTEQELQKLIARKPYFANCVYLSDEPAKQERTQEAETENSCQADKEQLQKSESEEKKEPVSEEPTESVEKETSHHTLAELVEEALQNGGLDAYQGKNEEKAEDTPEEEESEKKELDKKEEEEQDEFEEKKGEMTPKEFVEFAARYAQMLDAIINEMGELALFAVAEDYQQEREPLTEELAQEVVEKAILRAEKRSLRSLFSNRYDKEGYLILKENHFRED
jgi:hypothetical protein